MDTFLKSAYFVAGGAAFKAAKFVGEAWQGWKGLEGSPRVNLERPVVFVPGFTTPMDPYLPLLEHLTSEGGNGGQAYFVRAGQIYSDPQCQQPVPSGTRPEAKVFVVVPHSRYDTPPDFVAQLKPDLEKVREFAQAPLADMVGYSMGGISSRLYLDQGGTGVGKLLMVGTPNQGSRVASMAHWAVKNNIGWAMAIAGHAPAALSALEWLRGVEEGNPQLSDLNSRWPEHRAGLEDACVIGSGDLPTPGYASWGWSRGDTAVEQKALTLPGLSVRLVSGGLTKSHETLMADPDVFAEMSQFLGWKEANG